jgi:hypothetical protein
VNVVAGLTIKDSDMLQWEDGKTSMQVKLGELIQYFQVSIVNNSDGIPRCYIDPTVIMPYLLEVEQPDDLSDAVVEAARTPISFEDGFPTIEGIPFWERLEGEAMPYYKLFKEYREMKYLAEVNKTGILTRSIAKLAESTGMTGRQLNALSRIYHWQVRVKAYDSYKATERQLAKQQDINLLEEKHAKVSNQLLDQAVSYLLEHPEQLSPKVAIELASLAMRSGRLSLGLNPDKPGSDSGGNGRATNINITNQANALGNAGEGTTISDDGLSAVERKTKENSAKPTHLQSILHVLNQSGAFDNAIIPEVIDVEEIEEDYK